MRLVAGREVQVGSVGAAVEALPVVACPAGHEDPAAVGDHALDRVREVLPAARSRLLRGDACIRCGAPLTMPSRRTVRSVTVPARDEVPVLTLTFDLPSTRCVECGADQVPSRAVEDLTAATLAVLAPR